MAPSRDQGHGWDCRAKEEEHFELRWALALELLDALWLSRRLPALHTLHATRRDEVKLMIGLGGEGGFSKFPRFRGW